MNEIWNSSSKEYPETNLCAEYLAPTFELSTMLLHELAIHYNQMYGIQNITTKLNISVISLLDHHLLSSLPHSSAIHLVLAPLQHKEFFSIICLLSLK